MQLIFPSLLPKHLNICYVDCFLTWAATAYNQCPAMNKGKVYLAAQHAVQYYSATVVKDVESLCPNRSLVPIRRFKIKPLKHSQTLNDTTLPTCAGKLLSWFSSSPLPFYFGDTVLLLGLRQFGASYDQQFEGCIYIVGSHFLLFPNPLSSCSDGKQMMLQTLYQGRLTVCSGQSGSVC